MPDSIAQPEQAPVSVLVTGGAGFIGSALLGKLVPAFPEIAWHCLDALTYAGNLMNLAGLNDRENFTFHHADIRDAEAVNRVFTSARPTWVFHFAAETHVDRSIKEPVLTVETNVIGTLNVLEAARTTGVQQFLHVSTDEVFGSLGESGAFDETTPYDPSSPYSASKAASDHLVRAWHRTYGLDTRVTNCTNNYGPRQFPEKLMPLMILNAAAGLPLPVYGDGSNVRDWLFVEDHVEALWAVACKGSAGETYAIGGQTEVPNLEIVNQICDLVADRQGTSRDEKRNLIRFVPDRPGHDWRYAMDISKVRATLGWSPGHSFVEGLQKTVDWYLNNSAWVESVRSGEYHQWVEAQYGAAFGG